LTLVGAAPSAGTYDPASGAWAVGALANGASATLALTARVSSPNTATNLATVAHADQFDPVAANNQATAALTPQLADLGLTKTVSSGRPNVGDIATYTVTLTNTGPDAATGVQVTDLLPAGLTFLGATAGQGTYGPADGIWSVGTLAAGATTTLTLTARVATSNPVVNTATVTHADQFDPNTTNNQAGIRVVPPAADLALTKVVSNASPNVGDTLTYTVTLADLGPDPATGVSAADPLPAGLTFRSATASQGSFDAGGGVWAVGTVVPGQPVTLVVKARIDAVVPVANTAAVTHADQFDPNHVNNFATVLVTPQTVDLGVTKVVSNPHPYTGDRVKFTVTVHNAGPSSATGVVLGDVLPKG